MKLEEVTLRACCLNCRYYDRDERTAARYARDRIPGQPPVICPEKGIKEGVCAKFLPRRADVLNAIWRARELANSANHVTSGEAQSQQGEKGKKHERIRIHDDKRKPRISRR